MSHSKKCIAAAMISQIATLSDEPAVTETDFELAVQANIVGDDCVPVSLYEVTIEFLNDGDLHCTCATNGEIE